jgi:hypothetical protein
MGILTGQDIHQLSHTTIERLQQEFDLMTEGNGKNWVISLLGYYGRPYDPYYVGIDGTEYRSGKEDDKNVGNLIEAVQIYPNPASGNIYINSPAEGKVELFDIMGKSLSSYFIIKGRNEISFEPIYNGTYFLKININNDNKYLKIVLLR